MILIIDHVFNKIQIVVKIIPNKTIKCHKLLNVFKYILNIKYLYMLILETRDIKYMRNGKMAHSFKTKSILFCLLQMVNYLPGNKYVCNRINKDVEN